jgi:hypothetical protein
MKRLFFTLLRFMSLWAFACSFTSAAASALGRTFCLPPYWPPQYLLRCREGRMLEALVRTPLDIAVTTLFLFVPAFVPGAAVAVLLYVSGRRGPANRWQQAGIAAAGAVLWFFLVKRLEPSYLDFIIGGWATALGALAGALAVAGIVRSARP